MMASRRFYGSMQAFFRSLCTASKVRSVVELAKKALADDHAVVIGIQSTARVMLPQPLAVSLPPAFASAPPARWRRRSDPRGADFRCVPPSAAAQGEAANKRKAEQAAAAAGDDDDDLEFDGFVAPAADVRATPTSAACRHSLLLVLRLPALSAACQRSRASPRGEARRTKPPSSPPCPPRPAPPACPSADPQELPHGRPPGPPRRRRRGAPRAPPPRGGDGASREPARRPHRPPRRARERALDGAAGGGGDSAHAKRAPREKRRRGGCACLPSCLCLESSRPACAVPGRKRSPQVAEMTGRASRMERGEGGRFQLVRRLCDRGADYVNIREKDAFQCGQKLVCIISDAASTGISLQADRNVRNQLRRAHITLELGWSADKTVQQLGRTHRANQLCAPLYYIVSSQIAGERRFAAVRGAARAPPGPARTAPALTPRAFARRPNRRRWRSASSSLARSPRATAAPPAAPTSSARLPAPASPSASLTPPLPPCLLSALTPRTHPPGQPPQPRRTSSTSPAASPSAACTR